MEGGQGIDTPADRLHHRPEIERFDEAPLLLDAQRGEQIQAQIGRQRLPMERQFREVEQLQRIRLQEASILVDW